METSFRASGPVGGKHGGRGVSSGRQGRLGLLVCECAGDRRGGDARPADGTRRPMTREGHHLGHHASKARQTWACRARFITDPFACARALLAHAYAFAARALLAHARGARIAILVMGTPPSALQGHGDGQQQVVMQLPLMRRERLRLQAQQHGAGCRLVAFRHVEQTGGSSVREWMLRLDRMGQARFYGQTTRCAPPLADRYAPAQTVP